MLPQWTAESITIAAVVVAFLWFLASLVLMSPHKTVTVKSHDRLFIVGIIKFEIVAKMKNKISKISSHMFWVYNTPLSCDSDTTK